MTNFTALSYDFKAAVELYKMVTDITAAGNSKMVSSDTGRRTGSDSRYRFTRKY